MKSTFFSLLALLACGSAGADGLLPLFNADLVATELKFRVVAPDDVNPNNKMLGVYITVKNIGNLAVSPGASQHQTVIGNRTVGASVYGPSSRGGRLGDKLFPGESGLMSAYLPLGSLRHCASTLTHIDLNREMQKGVKVFLNDRKNMTAVEYGNIRPCLVAPVVVK